MEISKVFNKYALRHYYRTGANKGELERVEFFNTLEECKTAYEKVFVYDDYALNPTIWGIWQDEDPSKIHYWHRILDDFETLA